MRKEIVEAATEAEAREAAPWACDFAECVGGWWAFESADDAATHRAAGDCDEAEVNTLDETPCGEGIGWWHDATLAPGAMARRERTDITCADHGCEICAPHRAQGGRKSVAEIAAEWAADRTDVALWHAGAVRALRAVRAHTSDDSFLGDAAWDTLREAGYSDAEISEGRLFETLAVAFLGRVIAAEGACGLDESAEGDAEVSE